jgi:hypothetical protein
VTIAAPSGNLNIIGIDFGSNFARAKALRHRIGVEYGPMLDLCQFESANLEDPHALRTLRPG